MGDGEIPLPFRGEESHQGANPSSFFVAYSCYLLEAHNRLLAASWSASNLVDVFFVLLHIFISMLELITPCCFILSGIFWSAERVSTSQPSVNGIATYSIRLSTAGLEATPWDSISCRYAVTNNSRTKTMVPKTQTMKPISKAIMLMSATAVLSWLEILFGPFWKSLSDDKLTTTNKADIWRRTCANPRTHDWK